MKTIIFFITIHIFSYIVLFAEDNDKQKIYIENYFTYSSVNIIPINPIDYEPGLALGIESFLDFSDSKHNHLVGIDYRLINPFSNNYRYHSLQWYYSFLPNFGRNDFIHFPLWTSISSIPFGINMIYNFDNNLFSVGPKISYYYNIAFMFISFDYTYNITFIDYSKSFHQFVFKVGITFDYFF